MSSSQLRTPPQQIQATRNPLHTKRSRVTEPDRVERFFSSLFPSLRFTLLDLRVRGRAYTPPPPVTIKGLASFVTVQLPASTSPSTRGTEGARMPRRGSPSLVQTR